MSVAIANEAPSVWSRYVVLVVGPISALYAAAFVQSITWSASSGKKGRPQSRIMGHVSSDAALSDAYVSCVFLSNDQVLTESKNCDDPTRASVLLLHPVWRTTEPGAGFQNIVSLASQESKMTFLVNSLTSLSGADVVVLREMGLVRIRCVISTDNTIDRLFVCIRREKKTTVLDRSVKRGTTIHQFFVSGQEAEASLEVFADNESIYASMNRFDSHQVLCVRKFGGSIVVSLEAESVLTASSS